MFCSPTLFYLAWFMDDDFSLTFWCFTIRGIWLIISSVSVGLLEQQGVALWLKSLPREMTGSTLKAVGVAVLCYDIFSGLRGASGVNRVGTGHPHPHHPSITFSFIMSSCQFFFLCVTFTNFSSCLDFVSLSVWTHVLRVLIVVINTVTDWLNALCKGNASV